MSTANLPGSQRSTTIFNWNKLIRRQLSAVSGTAASMIYSAAIKNSAGHTGTRDYYTTSLVLHAFCNRSLVPAGVRGYWHCNAPGRGQENSSLQPTAQWLECDDNYYQLSTAKERERERMEAWWLVSNLSHKDDDGDANGELLGGLLMSAHQHGLI